MIAEPELAKLEDALAFFGASLTVEKLPYWVDNRPSLKSFVDDSEVSEEFHRVTVRGRECVPGWLLVEVDDRRDEIIKLWSDEVG